MIPDTRRIFQHHRDRNDWCHFWKICEYIYFCIIFTVSRRTGRRHNWEQILGFSRRDPHDTQPALEQRCTQPNLRPLHLPSLYSAQPPRNMRVTARKNVAAWGQATACLWQLFSDSLGHNAVGAWPFSFSKTFCLSRNVHTLVLLSSERLLCLVFMQHFMFSFSMKIQKLSKKYFGRQRKIVFISLFWGRNK